MCQLLATYISVAFINQILNFISKFAESVCK